MYENGLIAETKELAEGIIKSLLQGERS